ncbi:hypothetical protein NLG97_g1236 [Lecanicillium saksenae]|uniref:Uncharacterized protein n=1 Tax=Lecanicillium saksenae TaxID=468837 RepID=A0ACC1R4I3_9HYPO|nr:hypothetical protein NLG97_g1236 [Lecanicillium saksenae]
MSANNTQTEHDVAKEKQSPTPAKPTMATWKKMTIAGVSLALIVGLSVGLGVGLTRHKGDGDDDGHKNNSSGISGVNGTNVDLNITGRPSRWTPKVGDSWQIVLKNTIRSDAEFSPDVAVWDFDAYENNKETIDKLHSLGKKVICYFSAGTWEKGRGDSDDFPPEDLGGTLPEWKDERWARISSQKVRDIMKKRIAVAASKGCDAIDPDNVDGFQNAENNLGLTAQDSIDYMHFLHDEANKYNMSVGLKNAGDIIDDVMSVVDFSVNEQCAANQKDPECETFHKFIDAGKPVFHIEYPPDDDAKTYPDDRRKAICSRQGVNKGSDKFSTVFKRMNLDGWVQFCNGDIFETALAPTDSK